MATNASAHAQPGELKRALGLTLVTLYGLGVTVGAGIYVLIGTVAGKAGIYAPYSFMLAAVVVLFTGFSYAELGSRYPVSAGVAAYVRNGFSWNGLTLVVGLLAGATGVISAAAIAIGSAGYLQTLTSLPVQLLIAIIVLTLGAIALWGIVESVMLAAIFTLIEIGGLLLVIWFGANMAPSGWASLLPVAPPADLALWAGVLGGSLLAFFAFVGFEDIANVAEEVKEPERTIPRAIVLTLMLTLVLYMAVAGVVVQAVPVSELTASAAPLALIFSRQPWIGFAFTIIAIFATLNGILIQIIMASRLFHGMARQGNLPAFIGRVHPSRQTPDIATVIVVVTILLLALFFPIGGLAAMTSRFVLLIFIAVNASLIAIRWREAEPPPGVMRVPLWVPVCGILGSAALLLSDAVSK